MWGNVREWNKPYFSRNNNKLAICESGDKYYYDNAEISSELKEHISKINGLPVKLVHMQSICSYYIPAKVNTANIEKDKSKLEYYK